jgi:drug/metabolite transporter (DMT)-like permease
MLAWVCYATVALVWGSTYFAIAVGLEAFTPFGMVAARYLSGGVLAVLLSRILREPLPLKRDLPHLVLVGLLMLTGSNALVTWAELHVTSGLAAILCALLPLALASLSRERLSLRGWLGLGLGLAGVVILTDPFGQRAHLGGVVALLLAVGIWAYATLHGKAHVQGKAHIGQVGFQMLVAGVVALGVAPFTGGFVNHAVTPRAFWAVAYLGVFGSALALSAYVYLAKVWPPAKMGTYAYLNPLVAVVLGTLYHAEPFTARTLAGMVVILAGVAVVQLRPRPAQAAPLGEGA